MPFKRGQLRYFVTVAEEGQMTRAARRLHIAQPALSQSIAQLESELGVELLERHARGVTVTPAGEAFLVKARVALAAATDAALTAQSLARAARGAIEVGFIGSPPLINAPELFATFADAHPDADVSFRELPYPLGTTASWLGTVDAALCFSPTPHAELCIEELRSEPRVLVAPRRHALAERGELSVSEVLDETFVGCHPDVEPVWAGWLTLDDHRGGPPARLTADRATKPLEMVTSIASGHAVTALAACHADVIGKVLPSVVAIPLSDATPTMLGLVWRKDNRSPLVDSLVQTARELGHDQPAAGSAGS
jgi:DNA-binding transcriptional LysR family regulator